MKMPKFILRIGFHQYVIPHNRGVAALMTLLEDAVPVRADLYDPKPEIELLYPDDESLRIYSTKVSIDKIPRGAKWITKSKEGVVSDVRPVEKKQLPAAKPKQLPGRKQPALRGRQALQLEFGS